MKCGNEKRRLFKSLKFIVGMIGCKFYDDSIILGKEMCGIKSVTVLVCF